MDCVAALRRDFAMVPDNSTLSIGCDCHTPESFPPEVVNSLIARWVVFWESPPGNSGSAGSLRDSNKVSGQAGRVDCLTLRLNRNLKIWGKSPWRCQVARREY